MQHIYVRFGPIDAINPGCGYQIEILNRRGETVLTTGTAPDTGTALLTPADCMRVIQMYVEES